MGTPVELGGVDGQLQAHHAVGQLPAARGEIAAAEGVEGHQGVQSPTRSMSHAPHGQIIEAGARPRPESKARGRAVVKAASDIHRPMRSVSWRF
jgi:hypothetical protein